MRGRTWVWIGCGIAGIVLVIYLCRNQLLKVILPDLEGIGLTTVDLTGDNADVHLPLIFKNKPYVDYRLSRVYLAAVDDTLHLAEYRNTSVLTLKKNEQKSIPLNFTVPLKKIRSHISKMTDRDSIAIHIRGQLVFETFFGEVTQHLDKKIWVRVPVPPDAQIREVVYTGREQKMYTLDIHLDLINRNYTKYTFRDIRYHCTAEDMADASGRIPALRIPDRDTVALTIPVKLHIAKKLKLLATILHPPDSIRYNITLTGTIVAMGGQKQHIPIKLTRNGSVNLLDLRKKQQDKDAPKQEPVKLRIKQKKDS